ncbi:uncharacterized protein LOC120659493, partial [Panicum virgatum]|uniref:uncharacterized protein LOC120659493 n=1 Tax=Panicum virgatum TaxID=38727 RepID=UPI0019D521AB
PPSLFDKLGCRAPRVHRDAAHQGAPPPAEARTQARHSVPAQLVEDTVGEILLRLPPDDPASLVRASAVCKTWRRALADPSFPARYRAFHRTPPVLGAFWGDAVFVPTASFRPPAADHSGCNVLDCHHARVLLENLGSGGLSVWDPITGDLRRLPEAPDTFSLVCNGAVLCAATARCECDHLACHGGAFLVARSGSTWGARGIKHPTSLISMDTPVSPLFIIWMKQ